MCGGWSLGQFQDRYIIYSDGGDHICGRVVAGLNFNGGSKFAVLSAYFTGSVVLSEEEWSTICPCYKDYPVGFQACLPYLLATLVQHYDWMTEKDDNGSHKNISQHHPIFLSRVITSGIVVRLRAMVICNVTSGRCEATGMTATGIPPHIDLA